MSKNRDATLYKSLLAFSRKSYKFCFFQVCFRDKLISLEEYLEDGGWEGEAREEWSKEFLERIDTSKDGFLDRAEVIGTFCRTQFQNVIQGPSFVVPEIWKVP